MFWLFICPNMAEQQYKSWSVFKNQCIEMNSYAGWFLIRSVCSKFFLCSCSSVASSKWLDAHYDPVANLYTFTSCIGESLLHELACLRFPSITLLQSHTSCYFPQLFQICMEMVRIRWDGVKDFEKSESNQCWVYYCEVNPVCFKCFKMINSWKH